MKLTHDSGAPPATVIAMTEPTLLLEALDAKVTALFEAVNNLLYISEKLNHRLNIHNEIGQTMTDWVAEIEDKVDAHLVEAEKFKAEREKGTLTAKDYNYWAKQGFVGTDAD